jgi:hypothetical protein
MPVDDPLQIRIGNDLLVCESVEHASILEPVNEILITGLTDAYSVDQLEEMVITLERYDRRTGRLRRD